jgi:uncharacterized membrane protein HdeD (DUF308 family)
MSTASAAHPHHEERAHLSQVWWVLLAMGLLSIFVGFVAIGSTFVATLATVQVFGILLIVAGVAEVIHAIMVRNAKGFALHLLAAALYLIVGLFMLEDTTQAAKVLTLLLAASFLVGGTLRIVFSLATRFLGWQWVLLNGIINLVLGVMILNEWPESSLWVIGLFVGIDLLFNGWSWVFLAMGLRSFKPATPA